MKKGDFDTPEVWGGATWDMLLFFCYGSPEKFSQYARQYQEMVRSIIFCLPCGACQQHGIKFLQKYPPKFTTKEAFLLYILKLRDDVDVRLEREKFDIARWEDEHLNLR